MFEIIVQGGRSIIDNLSAADLTILAGILATALQYLLRKYKSFAQIVNWLLATVFPFASLVAFSLLSTPELLKNYPWAFIAAQGVYQLIEWLKRNAVKKVEPVQQF